jgi:hypothetical protein
MERSQPSLEIKQRCFFGLYSLAKFSSIRIRANKMNRLDFEVSSGSKNCKHSRDETTPEENEAASLDNIVRHDRLGGIVKYYERQTA